MLGWANVGMMDSGAFDIGAAVYASKSFDVSSEVTVCEDLEFSADGTKMYVIAGSASNTIFQYTLSTAWDVSTASYASKSFSVNAEETNPCGMFFKPDGTKVYVVGTAQDRVFQYTVATPWDISTASYATKNFSVNAELTQPRGLFFSTDGATCLVVSDAARGKLAQYTLGTPWDASTGSYASKSFTTTTQDATPHGICLRSDGGRMLISGNGNNSVYQYSLSSWDASTVTYDSKTFSIATLVSDASPTGVRFSADGTSCYVLGNSGNKVFQFYL